MQNNDIADAYSATSDHSTVFIVDDDGDLRAVLTKLMEMNGYHVEAYASGEEFLRQHDRRRRGCLLADFRMPNMNGLELQQSLAANGIDIPVIVMTGYATVPLAVEAMKAGAVEFLEKPVTTTKLLEGVRRAIEIGARKHRERSQAAAAAQCVERLTPRERQVLAELLAGRSNKMIAFELQISQRTVEVHRARIMQKMEAPSLSQLVRMALLAGLTPPPYDQFQAREAGTAPGPRVLPRRRMVTT